MRRLLFVAPLATIALLAVACGGSGGAADATPTVKALSSPVAEGTISLNASGTPQTRFFAGRDGTPGAGFERTFDGTPPAGRGGLMMIGGANDKVAEFLGLTMDDLRAKLEGGSTLAKLAEERGKTREALKAFLVEQTRESLQQAVEDGNISEEDIDGMLEMMTSRLDDMIDGKTPPGPAGGDVVGTPPAQP